MSDAPIDPVAPLHSEELIDVLAAIEHERWSHWQRYLHSQCDVGPDGSLTIPSEVASRWTEQMSTPYAELSEQEKESDRSQVRRYLPTIVAAVTDAAPERR